jgi:osmotically-inducible protein OsmY
MKSKMFGRGLMAATLLTGTGFAASAGNQVATTPQDDSSLAISVSRQVLTSPAYTIFDDIGYRIFNGKVELLGAVTQPSTKGEIEARVRVIPGVVSLTDEIKVLPASFMDDRLRLQIARAIYSDPEFPRLADQGIAAIHIIVENGHVTLTGVVDSDFEKQVAAGRAATAGLSFGPIVNNLEVENLPTKS